MPKESQRMVEQLNRAFRADPWSGPGVMEILADVQAADAAARPLASAHSIWELVKHMAYWKEVVQRRIGGERVETDESRNFPTIVDASPAAWAEALADLERQHAALASAVEALGDERLGEVPPGGRSDLYAQIHGVVQHDLYHAGQIVMLKKALAAGGAAQRKVATARAKPTAKRAVTGGRSASKKSGPSRVKRVRSRGARPKARRRRSG
jgi:uncharacterized damage-inducible protein DinB